MERPTTNALVVVGRSRIGRNAPLLCSLWVRAEADQYALVLRRLTSPTWSRELRTDEWLHATAVMPQCDVDLRPVLPELESGLYGLSLESRRDRDNRSKCSYFFISEGGGGEARRIESSSIWATGMSGFKDLLDSGTDGPGPGNVAKSIEILSRLGSPTGPEDTSRPAFVVQESGLAAIEPTYQVLFQGECPSDSINTRQDNSLVFFSRSFNFYVQIDWVECWENLVKVVYRFVPHKTKELSSHLALISLPPLTAGEVIIETAPRIEANLPGFDWGRWSQTIVAQGVCIHSIE